MNVRQDGEAFVNELASCFIGADRIREEVLGFRYDFELDPGRAGNLAGEARRENGFVSGLAAGGVRQDGVFVPVEVVEDVLFGRIVEVEATNGNGDDFRAGRLNRRDHFFHAAVASGADHQAGLELLASDDKGVVHLNISCGLRMATLKLRVIIALTAVPTMKTGLCRNARGLPKLRDCTVPTLALSRSG